MIQTPPTTPYRGPTRPTHHKGDAPWVKALVLGPAVVGSFCALVLMNHAPAVTGGVRRLLARPKRSAADPSLEPLRAKVLGRSKHEVMTAFGPPPAATAGQRPTWYYPVSNTDKLAMAVSFVDDRAVAVEFLTPGA